MADSRRPPGEITTWLSRLDAGDPRALESLVPLLYDELRALTGAQRV